MNLSLTESWVCYDRRSVGQSVLEWSTHLGLTTRSLLLLDSCGFVEVERSLWREDGSLVYNSCWPSPAQSFMGPSPVGLVTIFYSLRFETSLIVASYDSQGYGGDIRPRSTRDNLLNSRINSLYNFGRTDEKALPRTVSCYSPIVTGMFLLIFVAADRCVNPRQRFDFCQHIRCSGNAS
jgi:hypothetical protein